MKKIISLILVVSMALCLAACGSKPAETTTPSTPAPKVPVTPSENDHLFFAGDVKIQMHAPAAPVLEALGEPMSYTEETSCAFEGLDKTYYYNGFYLQTYPLGDGDYIYSLWLVDDTNSTPEGIYIGCSQADVEAAYGADSYNGSNAYVLTGDTSKLTIILEEGIVSSIQYDAIIE